MVVQNFLMDSVVVDASTVSCRLLPTSITIRVFVLYCGRFFVVFSVPVRCDA